MSDLRPVLRVGEEAQCWLESRVPRLISGIENRISKILAVNYCRLHQSEWEHSQSSSKPAPRQSFHIQEMLLRLIHQLLTSLQLAVPVSEPGPLTLVGLGLAGLAGLRRRK